MNTIPSLSAIAAPSAPVSLSQKVEGSLSSGIYRFVHQPTGLIYVGQSCVVNCRRNQHLSRLRKGTHPNEHFQTLFSREGESYFLFEILERVPEDKLDEKERFWIAHFRSNNREYGLNIDSGGNSQKHRTEETKRKMSIASKGRHPSLETRIRMSISSKNRPPASDETNRKISKSHMGMKPSMETCRKISMMKRGQHDNKGIPKSEEHKRKLGLAHAGKPLTEKHKLAVSMALKGRVFSDEHRKRISMALKGKPKSLDHRKNLSMAGTGQIPWNLGKPHSEETKRKISNKRRLFFGRTQRSTKEIQ